MASDRMAPDQPPVWVCPACGARLVTRNMWHSCARTSLDALFAGADPNVMAAAERYVEMLRALGDVQVIAQKSRLVCVAMVRFAGLYPRKRSFLAAFALRRWLESERIVKREDYGPRWRGHFVRIGTPEEVDEELRGWLIESHDTVGLRK